MVEHQERLDPKCNAAFILRGPLSRISSVVADISAIVERHRGFVVIIFQTLAAEKLYVTRDEAARLQTVDADRDARRDER